MPRLIDITLDKITHPASEMVADSIGVAVSFFERARGLTDVYHREVLAEAADPADLARLRAALVELVDAGAPPNIAGAAVFALGKAFDPGLTPFFVEVLRRYLKGDANVLYQAMIALDNLGVDVFGGRTSLSILAEAENRTLASEFLRKIDSECR